MYGMLAGNVSAMTGEYVKPAYGGDKEAFLKKIVTPIYCTIAQVHFDFALKHHSTVSLVFHASSLAIYKYSTTIFRKLKGAKEKKGIIRSGETTMILMNFFGICFYYFILYTPAF